MVLSAGGSAPPGLRVEGLRFAHPGGPPVLDGVALALGPGDVCCLLGPNGSGKTTLLRCVLGLLRAGTGTVRVNGLDLAGLGPARIARAMAYVPQAAAAVFPFTAYDVVLMGRSPHLRFMASPGAADHRHARAALARLGIAHLEARRFHELSGGERQLVLIARALAQDAPILVMDEPVAGLDVGNEARILRTIRALAREGHGVLLSSHRPDHAFALGGRVALLKDGRLRGPAPPAALLTAAVLEDLYAAAVEVVRVEAGRAAGQSVCVPLLGDEEDERHGMDARRAAVDLDLAGPDDRGARR
jgi:iron complex transport system ATP-binding protein